ncbi:MAG TPA: UDP-N-acetylmuramoyl-tripeptide--D-alanyl-D-alanine ligase [Polyangiaceae bacterium]
MAGALPQNCAAFSLAEVAAVTGGALAGGSGEARVAGVTTDSRADVAGKLFVALSGERFDGHRFVEDVARAGAAAVLVGRDVGALPIPVVRVESPLAALGALGREQRRRFPGKVVAVAGSAGKTTTRSAVGALLSELAPGAVHQTTANLNNLIGVPLVLLGLSEAHRYAVVEIGTNAPGEVARLAALVEPDLAVLTLIGIEHSEGLGDLDGIEREEGAVFGGLRAGGIALGNADDARVLRQLAGARAERVRYGFGADAEVRGRRLGGSAGRQKLAVSGRQGSFELELPLLGEAGAYAALAAVAVAESLAPTARIDPRALSAAFSRAGEPGRLEAHELADGTLVLDDAYNSNPASARASLRTARELADGRKARLVLVLGEMRELGALSAREHRELGDAIGASGASALIAVSGDARLYVEAVHDSGMDACFAADAEAGLAAARERIRPGDVVLVKASRGVRAERVVQGLVAGGAR